MVAQDAAAAAMPSPYCHRSAQRVSGDGGKVGALRPWHEVNPNFDASERPARHTLPDALNDEQSRAFCAVGQVGSQLPAMKSVT